MISVNRRVLYGQAYNDVRCLSTDEKPTRDIVNGSTLVEIDTGSRFMFDADGGEWHELPASGGGGGGDTDISGLNASDMSDILAGV